jgi:glycosyltransferase involved in cell wall biosynthesis
MSVAITVVIPAWNITGELTECVASVREQAERVAVVVVDNASDAPLPPLGDVEVVRLGRRSSVGRARNAGLERVRTRYVQFMEADDVLLPGILHVLRSLLDDDPTAVAATAAMCVWNPHTGEVVPARWPFPYAYRLSRHRRAFALLNCVRNLYPTTGPALIRTDAARAAGGFGDSNWAEDWAFGTVLGFLGRVRMCDRPGVLYRVDPERTTLSDIKERRFGPAWDGRLDVRRKLRHASVVPALVRLLTPLLVPAHFVYTLQDLRVPRQRA